MAKIEPMMNVHLGTGKPCEDVVKMLTQMLKEAQRGEIIGLAVAGVSGNNHTFYEWAAGCADDRLMMMATHSLHANMTDAVCVRGYQEISNKT